MRVLSLRGKKGSQHIFLALIVQDMRIGVGVNPATQEQRAAISLRYSDQDHPLVMAVIQELERRRLMPTVTIADSDRSSYVTVLFAIPDITQDFVDSLCLPGNRKLVIRQGSKLIMTGEAEFAWGHTKPFHQLYATQKRYQVHILDSQDKSAWGVHLREFETELKLDI